ncbi:MAG: response regulator transcription factor [Pseudoxanthomonas sp.]
MAENATTPLPPAIRLAVVEDDEELREEIMLPALRAAGFDVIALGSALELYRLWASSPFDLVLLDAGLPDDDGVEIARHLRSLSPSPGLVMYTGRGSNAERMQGLRAGVDAYLVKPLDMNVVVETLRNVSRRLPDHAAEPVQGGGWSLERQGWRMSSPSGVSFMLNQAERQVLGMLTAQPNQPIDRDTLITALTGDVGEFDPHRLEMLVYRLRRKCQEATGETLPLRSVRGIGYMFGQ